MLTSDDVMRLESQPASLVVQGAGPIGLELAQFFARIGTRVLLVNRSPLLSHFDAECGEELTRALGEEPNLELAVPGRIEQLRRRAARACRPRSVRATGSSTSRRTRLLMATGRRAALDDLGLEQVGLRMTGGRSWTAIDDAHGESRRSTSPATPPAAIQILHLANQEGAVAGHNAAGGEPGPDNGLPAEDGGDLHRPAVRPGRRQRTDEARREGWDVGRRAGPAFPRPAARSRCRCGTACGSCYACKKTGEILGSSILGPRADDLIHLVATLMDARAGVDRIFELPWYHPTLSEVILNIGRDAAARIEAAADDDVAGLPPGCASRPGPPDRSD